MSRTTRVLAIFFLLTVLAIISQAVFNASPMAIGKYFIAQLGSGIGITTSVPPNPFNTLAQQLKEKELALLDKEKELQQEEAALGEKIDKELATQNKNFLYLLIIGGILLTLILFNFYFDYKRRSE